MHATFVMIAVACMHMGLPLTQTFLLAPLYWYIAYMEKRLYVGPLNSITFIIFIFRIITVAKMSAFKLISLLNAT